MLRRLLAAATAGLFLAGCIPPPSPPAVSPPASQALQEQMQALPGAEVRDGAVAYPQGTLFSDGAVLFYAGGTETLGPLAALLLRHPQVRWQGTVRAESAGSDDHALALARARARLLRRFFDRQGLAAGQIALGFEAGTGADLTLGRVVAPQKEKDSSSSAEKE